MVEHIEHIVYTPLTEEFIEAERAAGRIAGEPIEDVSFEVDRRVKALIAARRLKDDSATYGLALRFVLASDRQLAARYLDMTSPSTMPTPAALSPGTGPGPQAIAALMAALERLSKFQGQPMNGILQKILNEYPALRELYLKGEL
jgi:hypothetical protein